VRSIICLFSANLNGICPFHMKEHVSLTVPSTTYNTLENFYPTTYKILLMFTSPSSRNFLVAYPNVLLNSNWHHRDTAPLLQQQWRH
jgi:hypothetical protein